MKPRQLTTRQSEVYELIKRLCETMDFPPTITEITENFHIRMSKTAINDHVKALVRKGFVVRNPTKPRSIRPKTLAIAEADLPELAIEKGDYCHFTGGKLTAITRSL